MHMHTAYIPPYPQGRISEMPPNTNGSSKQAVQVSAITAGVGNLRNSSLVKPHNLNCPLIVRDATAKSPIYVEPNSRAPIPVSNENCEALALLKIRSDPMDPHFAPYFRGKKRMFELQVQARMLTITDDEDVYIGIEGTGPLELSPISRGLSKLVIKVINSTTPQAHATLGDADTFEPAHMTMPLAQSVDRLHITPQGKEPPPLGVEMLPEGLEKHDRNHVKTYHRDNIYTLSMHGMYLDWATWTVVNVPGLPAVSLKRFMGDIPVRFVGYAVPKNYCGPHNDKVKKYLFNLEMTPYEA